MRKKILVVDDDEAHRLWCETILEQSGYDIDCTHSPEIALGMVADNSYDLIITDLMMPEMSGADFLKEVLREHKDQKAIILTGQGDIDTFIETVYDHGALEYLIKPIATDDFLALVGKLISEAPEDLEASA